MMEGAEPLKILLACIKGHIRRVLRGNQHEAIVNNGRVLVEFELLGHVKGKSMNRPHWYAGLIDGQVSLGA